MNKWLTHFERLYKNEGSVFFVIIVGSFKWLVENEYKCKLYKTE